MGGSFDLSSLFGGGTANANPLGALAGLGSGLGSGLGAGQSIGNTSNDLISQALGWTYGYGDQTGSLTAQETLGLGGDGSGGDGTGPTALSSAQQYMQQQQQQTGQNAQEQLDTGQPTPAQQAMAQQSPVSLAQAYGAQGPWAPGGSTSPGAAALGPEGLAQVAGPAQAATGQGGQRSMPSQEPVPNFFSSPQGYNLPGSAGPASSAARGTVGLGGVTDAINAQRGVGVGEPPSWATQNIASPMRSTQSLGAGTPAEADATQAPVPTPQPRPAAADAAPAATRMAAATPPASTAPAVNPYTGAATAPSQGAPQGGPQNPIQGIMQALGLQNLPPQMQQAAQQIIRQLLSQFMPQLQGLMGGQQGQMPYGGGSAIARNPYTGQPILDRQGRPQRWDQIPWSQGWDPAQQRQGQPWRQWQPAPGLGPGVSRDARGNLTRNGRPPDTYIAGQPAWRVDRSPSESGAPTSVPANPPPVIRDTTSPKAKARAKTAQLSPDQVPPSFGGRMTPEEQRREQQDLSRDPRGSMTPEQRRRLRELLKKNPGRRMVA